MAWLEQHPTSGRFKVCFGWGGQQFKKTVKTTERGDAEGILRRVEETISLAERGRLEVPPELVTTKERFAQVVQATAAPPAPGQGRSGRWIT